MSKTLNNFRVRPLTGRIRRALKESTEIIDNRGLNSVYQSRHPSFSTDMLRRTGVRTNYNNQRPGKKPKELRTAMDLIAAVEY